MDFIEIQNYTDACRTTFLNTDKGMSNLLLKQDASGRPTAIVPSGQIAVDDSGKHVDTGWNIAGDTYSIEQTISGMLEVLDASGVGTGSKTQRTETRVSTHDVNDVDKLYINGTLQTSTPALPTGILKAEEVASIGYPDKVTRHHGDLVVNRKVIVPTIPLPKVQHSIIGDGQADGILVQWNLPMNMSCDVKSQINVIIDGAAPVNPISVDFHPHNKSVMGIIMAVPFTAGQVITWAYDDTGSCDLHQDGNQPNEADNQTYGVSNNLVATPAPSPRVAFDDGFSDGFK